MKKLFLLASLVSIGIIGCTNDDFNGASQIGDADNVSMIKVDLKAAGTMAKTKAAPGSFAYGSEAENAVETVEFYFYDVNGNAYTVSNTGNKIAFNSIKFTNKESETGKADDNIEAISDVVLVIKQSETAPPAKVIAVINGSNELINKSLKEAGAVLVESLKNANGKFTMSNSVYLDKNELLVNAVEILPENIFAASVNDLNGIDPGEAIPDDKITSLNINPIDIYVERVAAKVEVTLVNNGIYDTGIDFGGKDVYAKVLGWNVTNNTSETKLIKEIDETWKGDALGFEPWNSSDFKRSYWTKMASGVTPTHGYTFEDLINANMSNKYGYYFENTLPAAEENSVTPGKGNQAPQLLVAAQLVDVDGKAIEIGEWYGVKYTLSDLQTVMVNTLASKLFVKSEDAENEFVSVSVKDVTFKQAEETAESNRYDVSMVAKEGVAYYSPAALKAENPTALTSTEVDAIFAGIEVANMWTTGYTYYYTTINHFGTAKGIVRNHCYNITIDEIAGLGTPIYDPKKIITPEKPNPQDKLNLAARINILSWSLVSQNVNLGN